MISGDGESLFGSAEIGRSSFGIGFGGGGGDGAEEQKKSDFKGNGDESLVRFGFKWICFDAARGAIF